MRLLVLGYVFNLDFSNVPNGEQIEIKPQRRDNDVRQVKRQPYGEVQTGVLSFTSQGATLQDWFESYEGKVADAPAGFDGNPANGGNPIQSYEQSGDVVTLHFSDGFYAVVRVTQGRAVTVETPNPYLDREEERYALETARALLA